MFFGILVVAGAALVIDQGILGPKEAVADISPQMADQTSAPAVGNGSSIVSKAAASILIQRLEARAPTESNASLGSVFSLTKLIEPVISKQIAQSAGSSGDAAPTPDQGGAFPLIAPKADDLPALSAVMPSSSGGGAVVGGKLMRVGDTNAGGYRLVLVHARSVLVEKNGVQYAIEMPTSTAQN